MTLSYDFEVTSPISPARLFKALVLEGDKVYPKAAPHAIKSVQLQEDGLPFQYVKHKIEGHDKDNFSYNYSLIEGGPLGDKMEKIRYENKFVAAADGGSVCKSLMKFYTVGDYVITEDEIKSHIGRTEGVYKAIETYLLANPHVCN
ncbi:hypothetical protein ES319_A10G183000v1 [Gossypium barbadense]|uniref:Bet v I/Major latex protein domain-containing protein n=2 Tax=Gossypium TaxID=3633 RepID=A0A5J5U5E4_GOSBA|nr:hypothetical protein ES319_A10G183000v1 [Gossypium barbadense]TYG99565.1 hypothetical protein ES288_A10G204800v1 [Gossypium darwinii]